MTRTPTRTRTSTPTVQRVRELVVSYRPFRVQMPVEGTVTGPRDAAKLAAAILADADVERVLALHFNVKHRLIGVHVVSVGTLDASLVHPRDVFKAACLSNAASLVIAHFVPGNRMRVMLLGLLCGRVQAATPKLASRRPKAGT